jgi:hypothetical protein
MGRKLHNLGQFPGVERLFLRVRLDCMRVRWEVARNLRRSAEKAKMKEACDTFQASLRVNAILEVALL